MKFATAVCRIPSFVKGNAHGSSLISVWSGCSGMKMRYSIAGQRVMKIKEKYRQMDEKKFQTNLPLARQLNESLIRTRYVAFDVMNALKKHPQYKSEYVKMKQKVEECDRKIEALRLGKMEELLEMFPVVGKLPNLSFGWPIVKYAIRSKMMDSLCSEFVKRDLNTKLRLKHADAFVF